MGDIRTHREIWDTFVRPHLPTDVDPLYVELGNYFTDISQFRDPWAHVGGKASVWSRGVSPFARFSLFADLFGVDGYFDVLLGRPDDDDLQGRRRVPHGKLAEWFHQILYVYAMERSFRRKETPHTYLIPPDDFKRLYDTHFTQYFPHEHVDFQPGPEGRLDDFTQSAVDAAPGQKRRIVAYLDADIEYIGDLLTRIERDWPRGEAAAGASQLDSLVRLGHACHAVEDYFFHSNFVELAEEIARPGQDVLPFQASETVDENDPEGDRVPPSGSIRWDRVYFRRKRRPIYGTDGETQFDDERSLSAEIAFTAAIPIPDIFHTFFDAIGHLTEPQGFDVMPLVDQIVTACESEHPAGELLRLLLAVDPDHLREIPHALIAKFVPKDPETDRDKADRAKAYRAYRCLVEHDVMSRAFELLAARGDVHRTVADAVAKACAIEKELWSILPGFLSDRSGAARFMITLLEQGSGDVARAAARTLELDTINEDEKRRNVPREQRTGYLPSNNGSTSERIGTHSLMSKDSVRKQPLRRQTINGAGFAVSYITKTLVAQRPGASPVEAGVDWQELLRHFIGHPGQAGPATGSEWWRAALEWDRTEGNRPPEGHQPKAVPPADSGDPSEPVAARRARTVAERAAERRRERLEPLYNDLSAVGETRFRDAIDREWVVGSMVWSSLVGGGFGLFGAGVDSAGTAALGTVSGMAAGLVAGAILSGIGTAVNDRAGSVVGLLAGLAAAGVGGYAVGRLVNDAG